MSTPPVARQAQVSPLHAIAPTFHDEDELSNISDDHVVDTNLEENLFLEIRTLVKKEKYLEQLEDQLREHGDDLKDSDPSDRGHDELDDDDDEVPSRRVRPRPEKDHSSRTERKKSQDRTGEDATKVKSLPSRAVSNQKVKIAREHYRVCFVEVNPVQLRDIRALVLVSQDLNILHLRTLSKNLFLFSSLQSVNLSDNQLDDSGSKEIPVLNTVKMANRLVALDLSFAFIGIPGAQVVAAALRIDGYATLTQLNMRCNRTKSMGAQAILEALSMNERLTSLDLSHNEIRNLSQNEMIGVEAEEELRCLRHAIVAHRGLLSLGQVNSLGVTEAQRRELQSSLDKNRTANDHDILVSINAVTSSPTDEAAPPAKRLMVSTIVELDDPASFTTVWQRKMTEEGRVSLKWKMAVRTNASASGDAGGASQNSPLVWKLVVNRKCEVRGSIEDEAASARFRFEEQGPSFMLYSAVAYCDEGDTIFLKLGIDQDASDAKHLYKIFVKDIVFIPHHPIEVESRPVLSRRTSLRAQSVSTLSQLQLEEEDEITASVEKDNASPTEGDTAPSSADMPPPVGPIRQNTAPKLEGVSWADMEPIVPIQTAPKLGTPGTAQTSKRRITYAADEISPHALDRLGVNPDILKKEKGMKKLGICDGDITRGEELRRYTGVSQMEPSSKVEFMFGFNDEQLHRERAIKRLGTTEQEIMDDYSRRVSRLGVSNPFPVKL
ncbi:hypothetical protein JG687_00001681 [Phytophthora cactorum]|uniref:Uncharacterized protein n=1 Tax=Phytophthora cactorum TaxID=29920 RepID=A0A8T1UZB8_9STRA|nr:hypothetical protein JG687_00001681 [Phytophthora cactorum]